jgi:hypothetical protein
VGDELLPPVFFSLIEAFRALEMKRDLTNPTFEDIMTQLNQFDRNLVQVILNALVFVGLVRATGTTLAMPRYRIAKL